MDGQPDVRVSGNQIIIDGVPPITIQNMEQWRSMSIIEKNDAIDEIYKAAKPKRVGRAAAQGATLGLSDEIAAAASAPRAAISAAISGESEASAPYYSALEGEREKLSRFRQQFPGLATASEVAGAIVPAAAGAVLTRGQSLPASATRMQRLVQSGKAAAKVGAVEGGLYGFGQAEGGLADRIRGTAAGSLIGAVAAPATQLATYPIQVGANALIQAAKSTFGTRGGKAVEAELQRLAEGTGFTPDEIAQRVADGEIMAENETLRMTVRQLMSEGGKGETMVRQTFGTRPQQTRQEAVEEIQAYLARDPNMPDENPLVVERAFTKLEKSLESDDYGNIPAFKEPTTSDVSQSVLDAARVSPKISDELNTYVTSTSKGSKLIEIKDGEVVLLRVPTLEEAEATRRYFRDKAEELRRSGNPLSRTYRDIRDDLEGVINERSPELASVRERASEVRTARDAYKEGQSVFNRSPDEVDIYMRDIADDAAAVKSLRAGTLVHLRQKLSQAGGTNLMNKLRNEETREGKVFRSIYPPEQIDETLRLIERAATSQSAMGDIIKGPTTALVKAAKERTGAQITAEDITNIGNPVTALRVGMKVAKEITPGLSDKQREQILTVLLSEDPEIVKRALTDTRGLEMLSNAINRTSSAIRSTARSGATQQATKDEVTSGLFSVLTNSQP